MKAYSDDLRERVLKALQSGQAAKEVAPRFDVGISWVYKIPEFRINVMCKHGVFK